MADSFSLTSPKRNKEIDLLRLLMAFQVMAYHLEGKGGYLAVEFFFLLTGYFAVKKAGCHASASYREAVLWTLQKYIPIYLYVIPVGIIHVFVRSFVQKLGLFGMLKMLVYGFYEISLLSMVGLKQWNYILIGHLWYLSCLLVMLPLFYALLLKKRDLMLYIICPLSILIIYGYFCYHDGNINVAFSWVGPVAQGVPRAWAGICLGGITYLISEKLREMRPFTRIGCHLLSLIEVGCLIIGLQYMATRGYRQLDFFCIGFWIIIASIALSERASIHAWLSVPIRKNISELSLSLYASHYTVHYLILAYMPTPSIGRWILYFVLCLIYATFWMYVTKLIRRVDIRRRIIELLFV